MGWVEGRGWPRVAMGGHGSLAIVPWMCGQCLRGGGEVIYTKRNACQGPKPRRGIERLETKPKTPPKPRTKTDQVWRRGARRWVSNVEKDKGIAPQTIPKHKNKNPSRNVGIRGCPPDPRAKSKPKHRWRCCAPRKKHQRIRPRPGPDENAKTKPEHRSIASTKETKHRRCR